MQQRSVLEALGRQFEVNTELRVKRSLLAQAMEQSEQIAALCESSNAFFAGFVEFDPFASFVKNQEGRFLYCNQPMRKRLALGEDGWFGRSDYDLWPRAMADHLRLQDLEVLSGEAGEGRVEIESSGDLEVAVDDRWYLDVRRFRFRDPSGALMLGGIVLS